MNKLIYNIETAAAICLVLLLSVNVKAQQPEQVYSIVKQCKSNDWYRQQAKLWGNVITQNPQNANAWLNYYRANHILYYNQAEDANDNNTSGALRNGMTDSLNGIMDKMAQAVPNSYEYNFDMYYNGWFKNSHPDFSYLQKAYSIDPNRPDVYSDFITYYERHGQKDLETAYLKKWYTLNDISAGLLNWNYNMLMSLDKNAVVFTCGDNDTYPAWMLQAVKGVRTDVEVINLYLFQLDDYRSNLCKELGIPFMTIDWDKVGPGKDLEKLISEFIIKNITNRPVYFAESVPQGYYSKFEDSMYLEGLAVRYSPVKYDNVAKEVYNFEHKFMLDYLLMDFGYDVGEQQLHNINANYIAPMLNVYDYYKKAGDNGKAAYYKTLIEKVATDAGMSDKVQSYFKKS